MMPDPVVTPAAKKPVRDPLLRDHARLDVFFENLLGAYEENDWADVREAWTLFEAGLLGHLDAEEKAILPVFEEVDPNEASGLRAEHDQFRAKLAELGMQVDLHVVSLEMAGAFVAALRAHAKREDGLLYDWAEWNLEPSARAAAVDRLMDVPDASPRPRRAPTSA